MKFVTRPIQDKVSHLVVKFQQPQCGLKVSNYPVTASQKSVLEVPIERKPIDLGMNDLAKKNTFLGALEPYHNCDNDALASRVKGTCSVAQKYQNASHIFSKESLVYHCRYFKLNYYPPDHFLSVLRKSKPAINVRESGEAYFNNNFNLDTNFHGDMDLVQKRAAYLFRNSPSFLPKQYAVYRRRNRMFVRERMVEEWCRLKGSEAVNETIADLRSEHGTQYLDDAGRTKPGIAKDGLYVYQVLIFPDRQNHRELGEHIRKSVRRVAYLQWDEFLRSKGNDKSWVQLANDRVRLDVLNKQLAQSELPFIVTRASSSFERGNLDDTDGTNI
ncbi:BN860_17436g1_1 [Zygosaccharomyces bailii CLIB 213]|uniref:BN860_17436g1_1 n=1 Tax=Zygosaccharomyces bailii (strain CLIB 213 / ATCC 58445 / CBS 680 / BCRC 21525 / NBRC 1098 / NCYC 1416 / NRRL Y-2227) TaxID=1333698 RepID=A0A8J2T4B6_ZYGB2|nr:BN860_17436g1_1 [Zygosaccharomyces bailii CLIB 213]